MVKITVFLVYIFILSEKMNQQKAKKGGITRYTNSSQQVKKWQNQMIFFNGMIDTQNNSIVASVQSYILEIHSFYQITEFDIYIWKMLNDSRNSSNKFDLQTFNQQFESDMLSDSIDNPKLD